MVAPPNHPLARKQVDLEFIRLRNNVAIQLRSSYFNHLDPGILGLVKDCT